MLAYQQDSQVNVVQLGANLDITSPTSKRYLNLLEDLLLIRTLRPWSGNLGKRLVKSPKIYIRDSGTPWFYRTSAEAEIDLVIEQSLRKKSCFYPAKVMHSQDSYIAKMRNIGAKSGLIKAVQPFSGLRFIWEGL